MVGARLTPKKAQGLSSEEAGMSRYQVDKLLRDLRRGEASAARLCDDLDDVLEGYQLDGTANTRRAEFEVYGRNGVSLSQYWGIR
jgi:hypothetical protein